MLETEITDAVKEIKDPERRINLFTALVIASILWGSLTTVVGILYQNLKRENNKKDAKIEMQANTIDSLNNRQYQYVLQQLQNEKQVKEVKIFIDSMNREVTQIKQTLISK